MIAVAKLLGFSAGQKAVLFDGTMPRSNRSIVSTMWSLVATMLSLSLTMMVGRGGGVRISVRQRDIRRVLRSVLTLVQGLLHSSEDGGRSGSESDSHGDSDADDRDDQRLGHIHPAVSFAAFRARRRVPPPWHGAHVGRLLEIEADDRPMLAIHGIVEDVDADYPDDPGGSSSAPSSLARVCLHLRQCRRGSNMHVLRVTCRDCGKTLRAEAQPDLV
jgi:hypothetical protein